MNRTIRWLLILLYFSLANCCSLVASETTPSAVKILFPPKAVAHVKQHFYLPRPLSPVRLAKLSAGFSSDADGEIVDYRWVVDGTSYRGAEIEIVAFSVPAAKGLADK